ncbi:MULTISPECIES: metallophosphoesterase [Halolamina]|uniref:Putative phosphoesterase n=1 Tax=Halolamina pelagica TaxID=699431 RepID=A0A1I5MK22_9EURY|nr:MULTISPECIES: metallophosphoesterase [Halolamina]NHX36039.1 metallophosphoesterase [Halolamina sp. R1-12]SFP09281.1 putative phosphoesterase [Halolamina pelagica]
MGEPAVEPVPGAPAATLELGDERALAIADYHAGIEIGLRYERGVELDSNADERRRRLLALLDRTDADRVVVLGDLVHRIAEPDGEEAEEVRDLLDALDSRGVPLTLATGNHDGGIADVFPDRIDQLPTEGTRVDDVGLVHGHTWPGAEALSASTLCMGHEHPSVRLTDEVGGSRVERAWLRGPLRREPFREALGEAADGLTWNGAELVVFPAFNDRSGGTWINVEGESFLAPFLPDALIDGEAYLTDGTRLGPYREV